MPQSQPPLPDEDPGLIFGWQIGVNVDEIFGFEREPLPQLTPPDNPQGPPILDTGDTDTLDAFFDHIHNNTEPPPNYGEGLAQLQDDWFSDIGPVPVLVGTSTTLGPQTDPTLSSPANLDMPQMTFPNVGPMVNGASRPASFTSVTQASNQHQNHRAPHHHNHHHHHQRQSHGGPAPPPMPSPIQIPLHQPHSEQEIAAATALQNTALFQNRRPDYSPYTGNQAPHGGAFGQRHQPQLAGQNHHSPVFSPIDNGASQPFGFTITPNQHASHAQEQPQVSANAFQPRVYMNGQAHVQPQPPRQPAPTASSNPAPAMFDNLRNPQYGSDPNFSRPHGYVPQTTQEESAQIEQERLKYVGCLEPVAPSSNETTGPTTPISPARRPTNLDKMTSEYANANGNGNGNAASIVKVELDEGAEQKRASVEGNDDESLSFNAKGKGKAKPNARPRPPRKLKTTPATARKSPSTDLAADTSAAGPSPLNSGDVEDDADAAGKPSSGKRRKSSTAPQKQPRVNLTSEQKRLNHINSEKRRRGNIKDQLQDLQSEIDPIRDQKMSKGVVAEKTFEFIEALLRDNQYLLELSLQHGWSEDSLMDGQSQQHNGGSQGSRPSTENAYTNNQSILPTSEQAFGMSLQNGHGDHNLHNGAQPNGVHQPSIGASVPHLNGIRTHVVSAPSNGGNDLVSQPNGGYDSYAAAPQDSGAGNSAHVHNPQMFHSPTIFGQWNGNGAGTGAQIHASQMPASPRTLYG